MLTGYLAPENFETDLLAEIALHPDVRLHGQLERLVVVEGPTKPLAFSQCTWPDLMKLEFKSIGEAAKALKSQGKLWTCYAHQLHRRSALIQEKLPALKNSPQIFGKAAPARVLGGWTLIDNQSLYCSSKTSSVYPLGEVQFEETKAAPSRAYLKLWEYFTVTGIQPRPGQTCLDLGACPGGWTWVLAHLGCSVISVDKAPLVPELQNNPRVKILKKDAFTLKPGDVGPVDWLFSDIICYPEKLLELVLLWLDSGLAKNLVCTIKFQGQTDFKALQGFQSIAGSQIRHLSANKHEVTWSLVREPS